MRKVLFISILVMTILDFGLTAIGIRWGVIEEANPLSRDMYHANPEATAVFFAVVIGALLLFVYKVQHKIRWIDKALLLMFVVKLAVLGLHFNWITKAL